MNTSMLAGIGIGVASALALSAAATGSMFSSEPQFAEVLASKPVTETIKTPRQECRNVTVTHRKPVQDEHKILGTVVGAALGGVVGHQFGGGSGQKIATAAGAVAGGYAGNQVQGNMQAGDTYTTTEQRCKTVQERLSHQGAELPVHQHHLAPGVLEDEGDGFGIEPGVDGVEHGAAHGNPEVRLEHGRSIGGDDGDGVPLPNAAQAQG